MGRNSGRFRFDGGAGTYLGTGILGVLITVCTLGICYPFALVLQERWRAKHSFIDGQRLVFTGSAMGLFGNWIKWLLLSIITLGIYLFWVGPRIAQWKWEHTDFEAAAQPVAPMVTMPQVPAVSVHVSPALPSAAPAQAAEIAAPAPSATLPPAHAEPELEQL